MCFLDTNMCFCIRIRVPVASGCQAGSSLSPPQSPQWLMETPQKGFFLHTKRFFFYTNTRQSLRVCQSMGQERTGACLTAGGYRDAYLCKKKKTCKQKHFLGHRPAFKAHNGSRRLPQKVFFYTQTCFFLHKHTPVSANVLTYGAGSLPGSWRLPGHASV